VSVCVRMRVCNLSSSALVFVQQGQKDAQDTDQTVAVR
jgi:hypothetical protein